MGSFQDGFDFFIKNMSSEIGAGTGDLIGQDIQAQQDFADSVNKEIDNLLANLNSYRGNGRGIDQLSGNIAEAMHEGTYNYDAATKGIENRIHYYPNEHGFASADLVSDTGKQASLKYYKNASETAKHQAISFEEASHGKNGSPIARALIEEGKVDPNDPIYGDMVRIGPSDQVNPVNADEKSIAQILKEKAATERARRPELEKRYAVSEELTDDRFRDAGAESQPLSREESKEITRKIKESKEDLTAKDLEFEKHGIVEETVDYSVILKDAMKAGLTAATISAVLKAAPEAYKAIDYYIHNGELADGQMKDVEKALAKGAEDGFIRGTISALIVGVCKSGLLGEACKNVNSGVVAVSTVIVIDTIKNSYRVAAGEISTGEMTAEFIRESYIAGLSFVGGTVSQELIPVPILGYLVGSFVGSVVGAFTYNLGHDVFLSFCANSGFTAFGLVNQDYVLPDEIIEELGLVDFNFDTIQYDAVDVDEFEPVEFIVDEFQPATLSLSMVNRGVIGVAKVGYELV